MHSSHARLDALFHHLRMMIRSPKRVPVPQELSGVAKSGPVLPGTVELYQSIPGYHYSTINSGTASRLTPRSMGCLPVKHLRRVRRARRATSPCRLVRLTRWDWRTDGGDCFWAVRGARLFGGGAPPRFEPYLAVSQRGVQMPEPRVSPRISVSTRRTIHKSSTELYRQQQTTYGIACNL